MRIISKFHDYYDIGMSLGQDEQVVWVREEETLKVSTKSLGIQDTWFKGYELNTKTGYNVCKVTGNYVALCGKLYSVHIGKLSGDRQLGASSYDDMVNKFAAFTGKEVSRLLTGYNPDYGWSKTAAEDREAWLNKPCHDLHIRFDCPLLLISTNSVTKCPNLKNIQFQRIKDPYSVFQEISMYISGVMAQKVNPTITLSDKSKILKKGFDPVYGFRRRPKGE